MIPIRVAIRDLRKRIGPSRPVLVFHIDQPSNDFNSLFDVLHAAAVWLSRAPARTNISGR
jgi:hypothetical protein